MINTVYQLVAPRRFEIKYSDIDLNNNKVIVRPTYLSICNADQRYYQGLRCGNFKKEITYGSYTWSNRRSSKRSFRQF